MEWRDRAGCKGMTEMFYGNDVPKCRYVCESCPVQEECLLESIETEDINQPFFGVRGGMIPSERIRWRMRRVRLGIE